ncbi:MAG: hypothetical protein QXP01_06340 [Candidatus Hadarchaeum sp.]
MIALLYAGVFLISAAMLFFELTLTRLFAVTQWYHFAFISVSVALLGFGASGTWLTLRPVDLDNPQHQRPSPSTMREHAVMGRLATNACLFSCSILIAYLALNYVPFDSYRIALEQRQLLYLALYYPALILPFFFAGLCIGLSLAAWPRQANALYAVNLAGSATGSLMVLGLVPLLGGTGAVISASILSLIAAFAFHLGAIPSLSNWKRGIRWPARLLLYTALLLILLALLLHPPAWLNLRLSPYKTLSISLLFPEARLLFSRWNAFSRVDIVESKGIHSAPGLSLAFTEDLPRQLGLLVDGGNLSPITCTESPNDERFLEYLPAALAYLLRPQARALVIEPRGGLDILTALHHGASSVVALESNPLVVQAVREQADKCGGTVYDTPQVTVVFEEARSYLRRSQEQFDVVQLSLSDTYQPVVSGAYSLSESYAYTVEAFLEYLNHLREEGILIITRWVQSPPTEELRACVLIAEALRRSGVGDPSQRVIAFRSWSTATILAKRTPFRSEEIAQLKEFCTVRNFDIIYYRGIAAEETNRYNILRDTAHYDTFQRVLSGSERQDLYKQYPYEISPTSDDRPFFFHYFKWGQTPSILKGLGKTWQPFGGSGFLILVALLALAFLLSMVLILLPLALHSRTRLMAPFALQWAAGYLLYFACLGLGFLFVEMPLLQQFVLFLGQPAYSFSLVLFSILLFSGLGSYVAGRFPLLRILPALVLLVLAYPFFLSRLFAVAIGWRLPLRLAAAACSLGPLGFLLGQPMPGGIRLLEERAPQWIPWAWAVNGFASVISSIVAVMGAVSFGFSRILIAGAGMYLLAWAVLASLPSNPNTKQPQ